jgi:hypothetical protein
MTDTARSSPGPGPLPDAQRVALGPGEGEAVIAISAFLRAHHFKVEAVVDTATGRPYVRIRARSPFGVHLLYVSHQRLADRDLSATLTDDLARRLAWTRQLYLTAEAGVTPYDPELAGPPDVVEIQGYRIEATAQPSADQALWAPVLTVRWTNRATGQTEVRDLPHMPPEQFPTAAQARDRAVAHGRKWVEARSLT